MPSDSMAGDSGLLDIWLPFGIGSGRDAFRGPDGRDRLSVRLRFRPSDGRAVGIARFSFGANGPPGHAHGGAVAYALDEAMGACAWMNHHPVVAARLQFEYRQMTPLDQDLAIEAWVESSGERRLNLRAALFSPSREICVEASGEFARLRRKPGESFLRAPDGAPPDTPAGRRFRPARLQWAPDDPS